MVIKFTVILIIVIGVMILAADALSAFAEEE